MLKHIWNLTFLTLENNVRNIETSSTVLSLNFLVKRFNKQLTIESTYIRLLDFIPSNMTDAERICRPGPFHDTQDESGSTTVEQEKKCLILGDSISIGYVRSMTLLPVTISCYLHWCLWLAWDPICLVFVAALTLCVLARISYFKSRDLN